MRTCLNRGDVSHEELIGSEVVLTELGADIGLSKARLDLVPVSGTGDVVPQPRREPFQPVLLVDTARDGIAAVGTSDDEGEDEEDEEEANEERHTKEVEGEKPLLVPVGADEAGEGDEQDEDAEEGDRPAEEVDALVVRLGRQPDPGAYDGNRAEEG